ncbi:lytic transglycosylase [Endozoicomonas elysicola]|uniref:Lytic transglycosylase n=1 Tax=Endozoicomonas elysicola TaxID=305900 RepID=A0A081KCC3_9GAMM|nr:LysM peptidoglycan-binding domain-containing protein [Endozoicomonas elysicola]KEI71799.1 lytic transglycosylase [Endozoicomonas elysicola]
MTKTPYSKGQRNFQFGPTVPKRALPTLAFSLFLTGCQLVNTPSTSSTLSSEKKTSKPVVEKVEAQKPVKLVPVKAPVVVDNLWVRIQSGLAMDLNQNNSRIQAELEWYKRHKSYFSQISKRSEPYLYFIVKEAEARNVPLELALMPIVESSFDPFAYSHAGASGLWQFMPETGEYYGLNQNWWYDGRRDVVHSTRAALDYMQSLYNMFGDWELALAAFNSGPGRVQRAVRKNKKLGKSTRFWALDLPSETTAYVPKLIALGKVVRNPSKHGVKLDHIPNKPYFAKIQTSGQLDMAKASKLSGVDLEELYRLNPGLNRWSTPPEGPHHLVVPVTNAEHFRTQLATLPPEERLTWHRYTVKAGDTLGTIAMEYRTSVNVITDVNKLNSTIIRIGQGLMIPVAAKASESYTLSASQRLATKQNRAVNGRNKVEYRVKSGDSFWTIAQKYNVGVNELARWNNMSPRDTLRIDQKLAIWKKRSTDNAVVRKVNYKVRSGDSLAKIASKFNVNVDQIRDWNTDMNGRYIHPGQQVTLFVNVTRNF